jgi:glycosyltransferase involved in cell wall biosynthesis
MKLLICTQKVDKDDDVLGFVHRWIEVFAQTFDEITVICLYKGRVDLPQNVRVFSLGKEGGVSRFKYVKNFYTYAWKERKHYDAVYVHMNAEYVILGWWLWKLLGKKVSLWYNHTFGNWKGKLGFAFANIIFHTSPYAFSAGRKKSIRMPAGIDTVFFKKDPQFSAPKNSLISVGRISKVKYIDVLIDAAIEIDKQNTPLTLDIYGAPDKKDLSYYDRVKIQAQDLEKKGKLVFKGSIPFTELPPLYNSHEIFINLTPQGNYDKTILEAMACERLSVVSSIAFNDALPEAFRFKEQDSRDLAAKLINLFKLSDQEKQDYGKQFREYVVKTHSLDYLAQKLKTILS